MQVAVATWFGPLCIVETGGAISALRWGSGDPDPPTPLLRRASEQLAAYAAGRLRVFDLPLRIEGAPLVRAVCAQIAAIPFGETRTYGEIAGALSVSAQAVGQACGRNPIPIFVPCHRVMGARGLVGYSGGQGIETKVALLRHEGAAGLLI